MRTAYLLGKIVAGFLGPAALGLVLIISGDKLSDSVMIMLGLAVTVIGGGLSGYYIVAPGLQALVEDPLRDRDEWDD
jgi:hypothetical protein